MTPEKFDIDQGAKWDIDLKLGLEREDAFAKVMKHGKVEHKRDVGCVSTGNLYVEFEQLRADGEWHPSGIAASEADYWAFEFFERRWLLIPLEDLKEAARWVYKKYPAMVVRGGDGKKTRGVLVPIDVLTGAKP